MYIDDVASLGRAAGLSPRLGLALVGLTTGAIEYLSSGIDIIERKCGFPPGIGSAIASVVAGSRAGPGIVPARVLARALNVELQAVRLVVGCARQGDAAAAPVAAATLHEAAPETASVLVALAHASLQTVDSFLDREEVAGDRWFSGDVAAVNDDGTYDICYDDGDREYNVREDMLRVRSDVMASSSAAARLASIANGDKVEARYKWVSAEITSVNTDGTYDTRYDDGDREYNVRAEMVRLRSDVVGQASSIAAARPAFAKGNKIEARYKWVSAEITSVNTDGTYDIRYDVGDREYCNEVKAEMVRARGPGGAVASSKAADHVRLGESKADGDASARPASFAKGDKVEARLMGKAEKERERARLKSNIRSAVVVSSTCELAAFADAFKTIARHMPSFPSSVKVADVFEIVVSSCFTTEIAMDCIATIARRLREPPRKVRVAIAEALVHCDALHRVSDMLKTLLKKLRSGTAFTAVEKQEMLPGEESDKLPVPVAPHSEEPDNVEVGLQLVSIMRLAAALPLRHRECPFFFREGAGSNASDIRRYACVRICSSFWDHERDALVSRMPSALGPTASTGGGVPSTSEVLVAGIEHTSYMAEWDATGRIPGEYCVMLVHQEVSGEIGSPTMLERLWALVLLHKPFCGGLWQMPVITKMLKHPSGDTITSLRCLHTLSHATPKNRQLLNAMPVRADFEVLARGLRVDVEMLRVFIMSALGDRDSIGKLAHALHQNADTIQIFMGATLDEVEHIVQAYEVPKSSNDFWSRSKENELRADFLKAARDRAAAMSDLGCWLYHDKKGKVKTSKPSAPVASSTSRCSRCRHLVPPVASSSLRGSSTPPVGRGQEPVPERARHAIGVALAERLPSAAEPESDIFIIRLLHELSLGSTSAGGDFLDSGLETLCEALKLGAVTDILRALLKLSCGDIAEKNIAAAAPIALLPSKYTYHYALDDAWHNWGRHMNERQLIWSNGDPNIRIDKPTVSPPTKADPSKPELFVIELVLKVCAASTGCNIHAQRPGFEETSVQRVAQGLLHVAIGQDKSDADERSSWEWEEAARVVASLPILVRQESMDRHIMSFAKSLEVRIRGGSEGMLATAALNTLRRLRPSAHPRTPAPLESLTGICEVGVVPGATASGPDSVCGASTVERACFERLEQKFETTARGTCFAYRNVICGVASADDVSLVVGPRLTVSMRDDVPKVTFLCSVSFLAQTAARWRGTSAAAGLHPLQSLQNNAHALIALCNDESVFGNSAEHHCAALCQLVDTLCVAAGSDGAARMAAVADAAAASAATTGSQTMIMACFKGALRCLVGDYAGGIEHFVTLTDHATAEWLRKWVDLMLHHEPYKHSKYCQAEGRDGVARTRRSDCSYNVAGRAAALMDLVETLLLRSLPPKSDDVATRHTREALHARLFAVAHAAAAAGDRRDSGAPTELKTHVSALLGGGEAVAVPVSDVILGTLALSRGNYDGMTNLACQLGEFDAAKTAEFVKTLQMAREAAPRSKKSVARVVGSSSSVWDGKGHIAVPGPVAPPGSDRVAAAVAVAAVASSSNTTSGPYGALFAACNSDGNGRLSFPEFKV